jgi:hypothetical protein
MSSHRDNNLKTGNISLAISTGEALGWLVRYRPSRIPQLFGAIVGRAERELGIGRDASEETLRTALMLDGGFGDPSPQLDELMNIAMPPKK